MKTLLRATALTTALALSLFAMTGHAAISSTSGICHTVCINPTTHTFTTVNWSTTEQECCSGTFNPCPAGSNPGAVSFQPTGGSTRRCAV
jgi:hypothetical protein